MKHARTKSYDRFDFDYVFTLNCTCEIGSKHYRTQASCKAAKQFYDLRLPNNSTIYDKDKSPEYFYSL